MAQNKIIFTGGGSAGHVTPNIAIIDNLLKHGWQIYYIGSKHGIEREIVAAKDIPYFSILTGKLRRYFCWKNFTDPVKIFFGILQSIMLVWKLKPKIIFSKGGFVSFPVVVAAWLNRVPVVVHESDLTPGLANRLSFPFASRICVTFAETRKFINNHRDISVVGTPLRAELFSGNSLRGREICGFTSGKKIIFVVGGGLGASSINETVRKLLPKLLPEYQIAHICGRGKVDRAINLPEYKQFEYLHHEYADVLASAEMVITRAGANTLYEMLSLHKPNILIPLSKKYSRGDQIANADYFSKLGCCQVIGEESLTAENLYEKIVWLNQNIDKVSKLLSGFEKNDSVGLICDIIDKY